MRKSDLHGLIEPYIAPIRFCKVKGKVVPVLI
jgi:hypothetical protein